MKFTVQAKELIPVLRELRSLISNRVGIPSLECIRVNGDEGHIELTADNFEVRAMIRVPAKIEEGGEFLVSASKLVTVLGNASGDVNFETGFKTVYVISGLSTAKLHTLPVEEFVADRSRDGDPIILKFGPGVLASSIKKTAPAMTPANREMVDGLISGLHIAERAGMLLIESTNRAAIHMVSLPLADIPRGLNFRISRRGAEFLESMTNETLVLVYENNAVFTGTDRNVCVNLLEGQFPNTALLIPQSFTSQIVLKRDEFLAGLKYAANFADKVTISTSTAGVTIHAISALGEDIKTLIPGVQKEELEATLSPLRLVDALSQVQAEEVAIRRAEHALYITDGDFSAVLAHIKNIPTSK